MVTPKEMVDGVRAVYGHTPGTRTLHAKGAYYEGTFTARPEASELTRAEHLSGQPVRTTVRLSNGGGDAKAPDYVDDVRGMAVSFHLADGSRTDLLAQTTPRLAISTPDEFLALVRAGQPGPQMAVKLPLFLARHPRALGSLIEGLPTIAPPPSYASCRYYPLHAFKLIAADGSERWVRYAWLPEDEQPRLGRREARRRDPDYLQQEMLSRLERGPARFILAVKVAAAGDDPNYAAAKWSSDDKREVGELEISALMPDGAPGGEPFVFDPMRLTDGIEPSDDPILRYRPSAYSESVERRSAEREAGSPTAS